jgi:hypothetical protein
MLVRVTQACGVRAVRVLGPVRLWPWTGAHAAGE